MRDDRSFLYRENGSRFSFQVDPEQEVSDGDLAYIRVRRKNGLRAIEGVVMLTRWRYWWMATGLNGESVFLWHGGGDHHPAGVQVLPIVAITRRNRGSMNTEQKNWFENGREA